MWFSMHVKAFFQQSSKSHVSCRCQTGRFAEGSSTRARYVCRCAEVVALMPVAHTSSAYTYQATAGFQDLCSSTHAWAHGTYLLCLCCCPPIAADDHACPLLCIMLLAACRALLQRSSVGGCAPELDILNSDPQLCLQWCGGL